MKIIADENIIYLDEFFGSIQLDGSHIEVIKKSGRAICNADLIDADVLLVRSVTQVNEELLRNTNVKFVGTATVGTEHIDLGYLKNANIRFSDARGCSADTVAQYVLTCIQHIYPNWFVSAIAPTKSLGIVGYGNIGKALSNFASMLGWQQLIYDPFITVTDSSDSVQQVDKATLLKHSDVISLHVPLTTVEHSTYPTHHFIDAETLAQIPQETLLINSARGQVISEQALLADILKTDRKVVLDVFEHEPFLDKNLVEILTLATPHIAGYSVEGKARGTQFLYNAFCEWQNIPETIHFSQFLPTTQQLFKKNPTNVIDLIDNIKNMYLVRDDDRNLRHIFDAVTLTNTEQNIKDLFDKQRKEYSLRREWQAYGLQTFR